MSSAESERYLGDDTAYASISVTAVVSFLLALASIGGVFESLLIFLGPMAMAAAVMALYLFRRHRGTLRGKWMAVAGLCIAALFTGWSVGRFVSHRWWLYQHAEQYTRDWLTWVEKGKLAEAFSHTRAAAAKNPETGRVDPRQGREFFDVDPLKSVRRGNGELKLSSKLGITEANNTAYIRLRYEYVVSEQGKQRIVPIMIEVTRSYRQDEGGFVWFVTEVE